MTARSEVGRASFSSVALGVVLVLAALTLAILTVVQIVARGIEGTSSDSRTDIVLTVTALAAVLTSLVFGGALAFEWTTKTRPLYWTWLVSWVAFATTRGLLGFNISKAAIGTLCGVALTLAAERVTRIESERSK
jgi:hypothetical protein